MQPPEDTSVLAEPAAPYASAEALFLEGLRAEETNPEPAVALDWYRQAFAQDPADPRALDRARALCRERGQLTQEVDLLELELANPELPTPRRAQLQALLGETLLDLRERDRAIDALHTALESAPNAPAVRDALAAASYDQFDVDGVIARLGMLASTTAEPAAAARVWLRAARVLYLERPSDPALEGMLRRVLAHDPDDPHASWMYETFLFGKKRLADLAALMDARAEAIEDPTARAARYHGFAVAWDARFGDATRALDTFTKALQLGVRIPRPAATIARLHELCVTTESPARFLDLADLALAAPLGDDAHARAALLGADVAWNVLADRARAHGYVERVRARTPDHPLVLAFGSAELAADEAEQALLFAGLELGTEATPSEEAPLPAEQIGDEQGRLMDEAFGIPTVHSSGVEQAITAWRAAIAVDPSTRAPRRELAQVLRKAERWTTLVAELKDEEAHACRSSEERAAVLLELAEVYRDRLHLEMAVAGTLTQALQRARKNLAVLDGLAALYERTMRWSELAAILAKRVPLTPSVRDRAELLIRIGHLALEKLGNQAEATKAFESAQELAPDNVQVATYLRDAYEKRRDWEKLLLLERRRVSHLKNPRERLAEHLRLAHLAAEVIRKPGPMIETWSDVLAVDPSNLEAIAALDKLYEKEKQWERLAEICVRQADLAWPDNAKRVTALIRLAGISAEKLADADRAIATLKEVLQLMPEHARARDALKALYVAGKRWSELEAFYGSAQTKPGELVRVLEKQVETEEDPAARLELWVRIALIYRDRLVRPDRAQQAYEKVLGLDPMNLGAAEGLIPIYVAAKDDRNLAGMLQIQAETTPDPKQRSERMSRLAKLWELKLRDPRAAFGWWLRALAEAPAATPQRAQTLRHELERLAGEIGAWRELVHAFEARLGGDAAPEEILPLQEVIARVHELELGDREAALAMHRRILEAHPDHGDSLDALERLYLAAERHQDLYAVYRRKLELTSDPDASRQLLLLLAELAEHKLGDDDRAAESYAAIVLLEGHREASSLAALDRIHVRRHAWRDVHAVLLLELELERDPVQAADLRFRLGQVRAQHLSDTAGAIDSYRTVLEGDPHHAGARAALEQLLASADPGTQLQIAAILERVYELLGEDQALVGVCEVLCAAAADSATRVTLLHRIAELYERKLTRPAAAFETLGRALREDPSSAETLDRLERSADTAKDWDPLVKLYREMASRPLPLARQVDLRCRLARLYHERTGEPERAINTYARVIDLESDNFQAIRALHRLYEKAERWTELADILRRELRLCTSNDEANEIEHRLALLCEEKLDDISGALEVHRSILARDPGHPATLDALERLFVRGTHQDEIAGILEPLCRASRQWDRLMTIYDVQLDALADPAARVALARRMAEISEKSLDDGARAFRYLERALHDAPLAQELWVELERLAGAGEPWAAVTAAYRAQVSGGDERVSLALLPRLALILERDLHDLPAARATHLELLDIEPRHPAALAALDRFHEAAGEHQALAQVLRRRIELAAAPTGSVDELIALCSRLGRLYTDVLGELDASIQCYAAILDADPKNRPAMEALEKLHAGRKDWPRLYEIYERLVDVAKHDSERAEILARMARLSADELAAEARAIELWDRVIDLRGEDPEALAGLATLHERRSEWRELITVLERQALLAGPAALPFLKRLGAVFLDKLGRESNALEVYLRARELGPGDVEVLRALALLHERQESWSDCAEVLQAILGAGVRDALPLAEQKELYARLGHLHGEILGFPSEAAESWQHVVALDAQNVPALTALETLYERAGRFEDCARVIEQLAAVVDDGRDLLLRAASVWARQAGDLERAAACYEQVAAKEPANPTASAELENIYRELGKKLKLAAVLEERVAREGGKPERVTLRREIAQLLDEGGEPGRAFWVLLHALVADDAELEQVAEDLERLAAASTDEAERVARWTELLAQYKRIAAWMERKDRAAAVELWLHAGRSYDKRIANVAKGIEAIRNALALEPEHLEALDALAELSRKQGAESELKDVLARQAALEPSGAKRAELFVALAELLAKDGDAQPGLDALKSAREADPSSHAARVALEQTYRKHERWAELAAALEARVADGPTVLRELAGVLAAKLDRPAGAIARWHEVLAAEPRAVDALRALQGLVSDEAEILGLLDRELAISDEPAGVHRRIARRSPARAVASWESVLALEPADDEAHQALLAIHRAASAWPSFASAARRQIASASAPTPEHRLELRRRAAQILADAGETALAVELYQDLLAETPDDPRALEELSNLYALAEEWKPLASLTSRRIELTHDAARRTELYEAVVKARRAQAAGAAPDEKFQILLEIGDLCRQRLGDRDGAIAAYAEAARVRPGDPGPLTQLVLLHTEAEHWSDAVEHAIRLAELERDPARRAQKLVQAAEVCRLRAGLPELAVDCYERALDAYYDGDPVAPDEPLVALAALDALLTSRGDHKALERTYLRMIERQPADAAPALLAMLWNKLAAVYDELRDPDAAARARVAASGKSQEQEWADVVISGLKSKPAPEADEPVTSAPASSEQVIAAELAKLAADPFQVEPYRALRKLFEESGQPDKAWCMCQALVFLEKADRAEQQIFERHLPRGLIRAKHRLGGIWDHIVHPDEDRLISSVFGAVWQAAALVHARPHTAFGLNKNERRAVETDPLRFSKIFLYMSLLLELPAPELYLFPRQPGEIVLASCEEAGMLVPAFVVGGKLLEGRSDKETSFVLAQHLAWTHPQHYLRLALPARRQLEAVYLAALLCARPDLPLAPAQATMAKGYVPRLRASLADPSAVLPAAERFAEDGDASFDLGRWTNAVDATAHRVGLILCGDLLVATRVMTGQSVAPESPPVHERIQQLLTYATSPAYFAVRQHLGIAITT